MNAGLVAETTGLGGKPTAFTVDLLKAARADSVTLRSAVSRSEKEEQRQPAWTERGNKKKMSKMKSR